MKNIHIHPETGNAESCRSKHGKCPFRGENDTNHFESKEEARKFYELEQSMIYNPKGMKFRHNEYTKNALQSSIEYTGKLPRWFKKEKTTLQEKMYGTKPEIIDVIDSPIGKLAVIYEKNSADKGDILTSLKTGTNISKISYRILKTGEEVAHLRSIYTEQQSLNASFGIDEWRGLRYLRNLKSFYEMETIGRGIPEKIDYGKALENPFKSNPPKLETIDEMKTFIEAARKKIELEPIDTSEYTQEKLMQEITNIQKIANENLDTLLKQSSPSIDSARIIHENLQGKGMGEAMYIYLARKHGQEGKTLDASTLQSEPAEKMWMRLAANEHVPTNVKRVRNGKTISPKYYLDFRNKAQ